MSVLVALCGNQIVGTIAFAAAGDDGHLRDIAVRPEWQGTGVASVLLDTAVGMALYEYIEHLCATVRRSVF
jgi:GNAT superfamily N-acetyltransferase